MSPGRFERIQRLFEEVCELSPGERAAFLEGECGSDTSLRSEIEDLLAAADNPRGLFVDVSNAFEIVGSPGEPSPQVFQVGETLADRFRIVRYIGRGGMGEVYEAEDRDLGENVAIKTLRSHLVADRAHRARLLREVNVSRKVKHPNLCKIHDIGRDRTDGRETIFLTMELIEGETLDVRLKRTGALDLEEALPIIHDLALGLEVLHDHHIVHRDFKPANVILTHGKGSGSRRVITDFGLAA